MSGQHQRDNGYSTSNHDRMLLLLLLLLRLLLVFCMWLLLMLFLFVYLVQPMLLLCFLTMAIDRGPWPTACPNATATALLHVACQLGSKVYGALLSRRSIL